MPHPLFLHRLYHRKMFVNKLPNVCMILLWCAQHLSGQGLYPPITIDNNNNFASFQTVTATSTCDNSCLPSCSGCNSTCPYGQALPIPVDLLEIGTRAAGVVSL